MSKIDALASVLAKMKAGEAEFPFKDAEKIWPPEQGKEARAAYQAFFGSLDAAMSLCEDSFPDYNVMIGNNKSRAILLCKHGEFYSPATSPSRALLIVILEALIEKEKRDE